MDELKKLTKDQGDIRSLADVARRLEAIGKSVKPTEFKNVGIFNTAYLTVTRGVERKLHTDYFDDDEIVERLDVEFMKYYMRAFERYLETGSTVPAWQALFESCVLNQKRMGYLALGVNAHVNNDLGLALKDINAPAKFHADFVRINLIIDELCDEIIQKTHIHTFLDPVVRVGMRVIIHRWRVNAWRVYCKTLAEKWDISRVEHQAYRIAKTLYRLPWLI